MGGGWRLFAFDACGKPLTYLGGGVGAEAGGLDVAGADVLVEAGLNGCADVGGFGGKAEGS